MPTPLLEVLKEIAERERQLNQYKSRVRVKGKIVRKEMTKNGNISLTIGRNKASFKFIVLKSHKERFAFAQKLAIGRSVSVIGINKLKMNICTRLLPVEKGISDGKQRKLEEYE